MPFDESIDRDNSRLDAGQGLPNLPGDILDMTGSPGSLIDPAALPIDPPTCQRVYPHSYLKVNTRVETTQIAPTILELLDINPRSLQAVRSEHTQALRVTR